MENMKDYKTTIWADGFHRWHARADFTQPLGNTGEAERVASNALKTMKRQIRKAMLEREEIARDYRLSYAVIDNGFQYGTGCLTFLEIAEK